MTQAEQPTEKPKSTTKGPEAKARKGVKAANDDSGAEKSLFEDFDALSEYLVETTGAGQEVVRDFFMKQGDALKVATGKKSADPLNVGESLKEMMEALAADPGTVMQRQFNLWGDYAKLMATMGRPH